MTYHSLEIFHQEGKENQILDVPVAGYEVVHHAAVVADAVLDARLAQELPKNKIGNIKYFVIGPTLE